MQEEAPEAPAQIIRSVILLPQYDWQLVLVSRGRAACCRRGGVLAAATHTQTHQTLETFLSCSIIPRVLAQLLKLHLVVSLQSKPTYMSI